MVRLVSVILAITAIACESKTLPGVIADKVQEIPLVEVGVEPMSLHGRTLPTCTNRAGVTCMCQNPSFPCFAPAPSGTGCACHSLTTNATCTAARGVLCVRPARCVANCSLCQDTRTCLSCAAGYMVLRGQCTKRPRTVVDTWLKVHNLFRCMHGSSYVRWNNFSAASAQAYVNTLRTMVHSNSYSEPPPAGPAGENLAMGFGNLVDAVTAWYNEVICCGPFPGCATNATCETGHFTPMVWAGVSEIGCAVNTTTRIYICRYRSGNVLSSRTANMAGAFAQNVLALQKPLAQCIGEADGTIPTTVTSTTTGTLSTTTTGTVTRTTRTIRPWTFFTSTTRATSSSTTSTSLPFEMVDGGVDRACRGANPTDKVASYYLLYDPLSPLSACQALCLNNTLCVGIQYSLWNRCEVWTRPQGIQASASVTGFTCMRLLGGARTGMPPVNTTARAVVPQTSSLAAPATAVGTFTTTATVTGTVTATTSTVTATVAGTTGTATSVTRTGTVTATAGAGTTGTTTLLRSTTVTRTATVTQIGTTTLVRSTTQTRSTRLPFEMVDGGTDRACRGANATDKVPSYFLLYDPLWPQSACEALCLSNTQCVGVQYSMWHRCEVWIRPGGINFTAIVPGYTCLRRVRP